MRTIVRRIKFSHWAKWFAIDKNGECWEYSHKPKLNIHNDEEWDTKNENEEKRLLYHGIRKKNWKNSITKINGRCANNKKI